MPRRNGQQQAEGYTDWKGWSGGSFGRIGPADVDYFSREMRRLRPATPIKDVLEVGFGNGEFLSYCRSQGWNATGVELLPELVEHARSAGFAAHQSDDLDSVPDAGFDVVAAFDVFEHVPPEHSIAFLADLRRKVRPGGTVILRYPNADTWLGNPFQNGDPTHVNAIGALKMEYYAGEVGLGIRSLRAPIRRGFHSSFVHGAHAMTAGVLARAAGAVAKAIYFPDLRVVLSAGNVVCVLDPVESTGAGASASGR